MTKKSSPMTGRRHPSRSEPVVNQDALLRLVGYNCRRSYLHIFLVYQKRMEMFALKPVEFSILALIHTNKNPSQNRLARALGIKPSNMATMLHRLGARSLVIRKKDQPDKRFHALELSAKGRRVFTESERVVDRLEIEATSQLSKPERIELLRLLQKIFLVK
jgi:DNA-binding MarR family transcriptional regulator